MRTALLLMLLAANSFGATPTPIPTSTIKTGFLKVPSAGAVPRVAAIQQSDVVGLSTAVTTRAVYDPILGLSLVSGTFPPAGNPWIMLGNPTQPDNETTIFGRMETVPVHTNRSGGIVGTGYWVIDVDGGMIFNTVPISWLGGTGSGFAWRVTDHDIVNRFGTFRAYLDPAVTDEYLGLNLFSGCGVYTNGGTVDAGNGPVTNVGSMSASVYSATGSPVTFIPVTGCTIVSQGRLLYSINSTPVVP
jgi:hypothetical protein